MSSWSQCSNAHVLATRYDALGVAGQIANPGLSKLSFSTGSQVEPAGVCINRPH